MMPAPDENSTALDHAKALATLGLRVVPIKPGHKRPALPEWQNAATNDLAIVNNWWTGIYRDHGVGIAMGPQPNGTNLVAIDLDRKNDTGDGIEEFEALLAQHQDTPQPIETWIAVTGSGGRHLIFDLPAGRTARNQQGAGRRLGPNIDIRGEGGQIVVAPTIHPVKNAPYWWLSAPWAGPVAPMVDWLADLVCEPVDEPQVTPQASPPKLAMPAAQSKFLHGDRPSIADELRDGWDWAHELNKRGWTLAKTVGTDEYWTRPGKDPRHGHSAVLHEGGPLVVFSNDDGLAGLFRSGKINADGSGASLSPLAFVAGSDFRGDTSAAATALHAQRAPVAPVPRVNTSTGEIITTDQTATNLPNEFWEYRPELAHIRQAAHHRLVSADACLLTVLARVVTLVPPTVALPAIVGGEVSLNLFGSIIDPSGGGKSAAVSAARKLVPIIRKDIVDPILPSSGEGLIEAFMGYDEVEGPDGKKRKERRQVNKAGFAYVDEGQGLLAQADRSGSTIMETIRSSWMGHDLGQHNASDDRKRWLKEHEYRLCMIVGFQLAYAAHLITDSEGGTPQRFTFALATDPNIDPDVADPGPLALKRFASVRTGQTIDVDADVAAGIRARRVDRSKGIALVDPLESHADLRRLKLAAALGLLDGRLSVTKDDWELAGEIDDVSCAVRSLAVERDRGRRAAERAAGLRLAAEREEALDHAKVRRCTEAATKSISRRVWREGETTLKAAWRMVKSDHRKNADPEDALALAIDRQWLTSSGDVLSRGAVDPR